jgi:hypothetical protein
MVHWCSIAGASSARRLGIPFTVVMLVALWALAAPAAAQSGEAWQTAEGRACMQRWITQVAQVLNRHSGDADFNKRKPWSINQYGLFQAEGLRSASEPDDWLQYGADISRWMWAHYDSELELAPWDNVNFRDAGLKGLRWSVRQCLSVLGPGAERGTEEAAIGPGPEPGTEEAAISPGPAAGTGNAPAAMNCPANMTGYRSTTTRITCQCHPDFFVGSVWGTGFYTDDSVVCNAALHAGAVTRAGGTVTVEPAPGRPSYTGSERNGVSSSNYGEWGGSFYFLGYETLVQSGAANCPANMAAHRGSSSRITCQCMPDFFTGSVWGTDFYTDDSSICNAALHAGAVTQAGGTVTVEASSGRPNYVGSPRNGVSSSNYGQWGGSFYFPAATPTPATSATAPNCPAAMSTYRGTSTRVSCQCTPQFFAGAVWGTDYYTDDSSVCQAALHAGAVTQAGGVVTVVAAPGRPNYVGSHRNGVPSGNYGQWGGSFYFER